MKDRLDRIAARVRHAAYLDALGTSGASLSRAPDEHDLEIERANLRYAGGTWAARARGILTK